MPRLVPEFPPETAAFADDGPGAMNTGCCTLCRLPRDPRHPGVVELGPNARPFMEGMVVLCWRCATEVGALAGMMPPEQADRLRSDLAEARSAVVDAEATIASYESIRSALGHLTTGSKVAS